MQRTTIICAVLALLLAAFLILGCEDKPQPDYCNLDPKPLICKQQ